MAATKINLPMPARALFVPRNSAGRIKYDLASLTPGTDECIAEDGIEGEGAARAESVKAIQSRLSSAVSSYRKREGAAGARMQFTIRAVKDANGQVIAVAVWRLADLTDEEFAAEQAKKAKKAAQANKPADQASADTAAV